MSEMSEMVRCPTCSVSFRVDRHFHGRCKDTKRTFWCPAGHAMTMTRSSEDELRDRVQRLELALADRGLAIEALRFDLRREERRSAALRGVITRMKKRAP